jgi:2-polyprenyl-3-methyl-5-hydroxy-6-metoxy-1,4-benzoquinol methylase
MKNRTKSLNIDDEVVDHFGKEWAKYNYLNGIASEALDKQFMAYTSPIDLEEFDSESSVAADFGAGSGRWAERLAPFFHKVYALEPSAAAVQVMNEKFSKEPMMKVLNENVEENSIPENSLDLAISLGVLHHIPDTSQAILDVGKKIKSGGTFLCYLYYKIEDKPFYYRAIFRIVNVVRFSISRMPHVMRMFIAKLIAFSVYLPLARFSRFLLKNGKDVSNIPLHHYSEMPFVMLENDALDRFGTRLEQRFNKIEIAEMLSAANFNIATLKFSEAEPFWTFAIRKN